MTKINFKQVLSLCLVFALITAMALTMVSCDNFKLAKCDRVIEYQVENDGEESYSNSFILPVKTVNELVKLLSDNKEKTARLFMTRKNIVFEIGEVTFFSRLIEGEYLDYDRIIVSARWCSFIIAY